MIYTSAVAQKLFGLVPRLQIVRSAALELWHLVVWMAWLGEDSAPAGCIRGCADQLKVYLFVPLYRPSGKTLRIASLYKLCF